MLRATIVRNYPTPRQAEFLIAQFGAMRFAYNKTLHLISHMYHKHGVALNPKKDIKPLLVFAKKSRKYQLLKQYDSIALQQFVNNLHQVFNNVFNPKLKAKYPQSKRKNGKQSSYHCVGVQVLEGAVKLAKMELIEANIHRDIAGIIKSITVSLYQFARGIVHLVALRI